MGCVCLLSSCGEDASCATIVWLLIGCCGVEDGERESQGRNRLLVGRCISTCRAWTRTTTSKSLHRELGSRWNSRAGFDGSAADERPCDASQRVVTIRPFASNRNP